MKGSGAMGGVQQRHRRNGTYHCLCSMGRLSTERLCEGKRGKGRSDENKCRVRPARVAKPLGVCCSSVGELRGRWVMEGSDYLEGSVHPMRLVDGLEGGEEVIEKLGQNHLQPRERTEGRYCSVIIAIAVSSSR